jgi:hypothetical protein
MVGFYGAQHVCVHVDVEAPGVCIMVAWRSELGEQSGLNMLSASLLSDSSAPKSQGSEQERQSADETGTSTALSVPQRGSMSSWPKTIVESLLSDSMMELGEG